MNWTLFAAKLPLVIAGAMQVMGKVRLPGLDKKAAVLAALPDSIHLAEFAAGKDVFNDAGIVALAAAVIDAERAVEKAREALKAGVLAKAA
jgi:hypothetical protein